MIEGNPIIIYQTQDGQTSLDVKLDGDTVWLTQKQISTLFAVQRPAITKHLANIFRSGELDEAIVCSVLEHTAEDNKIYKTKFYNLDVILSIGYRINSKYATQFRIWANRILKDHLIKGYTINEKRIQDQKEQYDSLKHTIKLLGTVLESKKLDSKEVNGLLKVITDYTHALDILDRYDHQQLIIEKTHQNTIYQINYKEAIEAIKELKSKLGGSNLFGKEKDDSFKSSLLTIYQSFAEQELYPSIEEKAAHLLYFVVKNHSFVDGNKRIAAFLFVWFLEKNKLLYKEGGSKRIANNALVALTLMIAESKPEEKDIIVKVVVNLINSKN